MSIKLVSSGGITSEAAHLEQDRRIGIALPAAFARNHPSSRLLNKGTDPHSANAVPKDCRTPSPTLPRFAGEGAGRCSLSRKAGEGWGGGATQMRNCQPSADFRGIPPSVPRDMPYVRCKPRPAMPCWRMPCAVTPTGPLGFQVTATGLPGETIEETSRLIADFGSLAEAEVFAASIRQIGVGRTYSMAPKELC
jgi:hypothetical protein